MDRIKFCEAIRDLPEEYAVYLTEYGSVFCKGLRDAEGNDACLIVAVCFHKIGKLFTNKTFHEAGAELGMDWALRHNIVSCVDAGKATPDKSLRNDLLNAAKPLTLAF